MEREMAGVSFSGAAPAAKKHGVKSVVLGHTRTHELQTETSLKKCVGKEGLQGTDRQEEVMIMTVLPCRRTVDDSACSTTSLHLRMPVGKKECERRRATHESVGHDWTTQRATGMITHLIQEMQDVTLVAASVHAWSDISRCVVHTDNVERALGKIKSVLFASVTCVVVAVFNCFRIGSILVIKGSCTVTCTGMDAVFNVTGEFRYLPRCTRELQERTHDNLFRGRQTASCKLMVVGFFRVLRLKHRLTMEIAEVPTAFRLKVKNIDNVRLDMNWSEVQARIVEEQNQTELLMCVTLLPRQFVEPPTEQQADQGSVLALKGVDGV